MRDMSGSELKVVLAIIRQTLGYHKETAKFSIQKIIDMTGLSANSVIKGAREAEQRGLLLRTNPDDISSAEWELIINTTPSKIEPPQKLRGLEPKPPQKLRGTPSKIELQVGLNKTINKDNLNKDDKAKVLSFTDSSCERLFCEVTGLFTIPNTQRLQNDFAIIRGLLSKHGIEKTREILTAWWLWWIAGKTQKGIPYNRTNTAWLDKAQLGDMPGVIPHQIGITQSGNGSINI